MTVNQQKEGKIHTGESDRWVDSGLEQQLDQSTCESQHSISCVQPVFESRSGQRVSSEFNDRGGKRERQSISSVVVWEIPNATILTMHGSLDDVQTKLVMIRQKLDTETARWSRLLCDQFSRRVR